MRTMVATALLLAAVGAFLTACGSATTDQQSTCDQAFAQAMAIDPGSDTVSDVDGSIAGCQSLESWVAAAKQFPDAFGGRDPAAVASERCAASPALQNTAICIALR